MKYIDDLKSISVRVSLGLKPMYEKDLYTTPYKRISAIPAIACGPEGLYVFEGVGRDHLMQFSLTGEYIKTIYPFPASKIDKVKGLTWWSYGNRDKIPQKNSGTRIGVLFSALLSPTIKMKARSVASAMTYPIVFRGLYLLGCKGIMSDLYPSNSRFIK